MSKNKKFEGMAEGEPIPKLVAPLLYLYARRGDSKNPKPYVWVITYESIDSDYERLKEALKEHNYWERYYLTGKLKIRCIPDGYEYAFEDRPVIYVQDGDIYVVESEYKERPHVCEHQAAFTASIFKTLGLVTGYRRERRPMTEEELSQIPRGLQNE